MANFSEQSRYKSGIVTKNRSGESFLVLRRPLTLDRSDGDTFITVTQEFQNRPDLIAFNAYGTSELWWVIYEYNNIRDPFFDLKIGTTLLIPQLERVLQAISEIEED